MISTEIKDSCDDERCIGCKRGVVVFIEDEWEGGVVNKECRFASKMVDNGRAAIVAVFEG